MKYLHLSFSLFFILFFTFVPSLTDAENSASDDYVKENTPIFHLYNDIDLISIQKIIYGKPRIVVKAVYPRLESDVSRDDVDKFNEIIAGMIQDETTSFQKKVKDVQKGGHNKTKSGKNDLLIDYDSSVIQTGKYHLISIRMRIEGMIMGMAHPFHNYRQLNFNLDTGETIELKELFRDEVEYLSFIANYSKKILMRRLDDKEMIQAGTAPTQENYEIWNIKPSGLVFTFKEYQVAPYVYGAQTVLIPYAILKPILSTKSPLTKCMRRQNCTRHHLVTGGFIEEAINTLRRFQSLITT